MSNTRTLGEHCQLFSRLSAVRMPQLCHLTGRRINKRSSTGGTRPWLQSIDTLLGQSPLLLVTITEDSLSIPAAAMRQHANTISQHHSLPPPRQSPVFKGSAAPPPGWHAAGQKCLIGIDSATRPRESKDKDRISGVFGGTVLVHGFLVGSCCFFFALHPPSLVN
jgi:hypothetical protein